MFGAEIEGLSLGKWQMNLDKSIVDKKTFPFYFIFSLKFNFSICWSQREFNVRYYGFFSYN